MTTTYYVQQDNNQVTCDTGAAVDADLGRNVGSGSHTAGTANVTFTELFAFDVDIGGIGSTGSHTVSLNVTAVDNDSSYRFRVQSINDAGPCSVTNNSSYSATYTTAGVKSEALSLTWGVNANRLRISVEVLSRDGADAPITITLGSSSFVTAPWDPGGTDVMITATEQLAISNPLPSTLERVQRAVAPEAAAFSPAASRLVSPHRLLSEQLDLMSLRAGSFNDVLRQAVDAMRLTNPSPSTLERVLRALSAENIEVSYNAGRLSDILRGAVESLVMPATLDRLAFPHRSILENLSIADALARFAPILRSASELMPLADPSSGGQETISRLLNPETAALPDAFSLQVLEAGIAILAIELLSMPESASSLTNALRSIAESLVLYDPDESTIQEMLVPFKREQTLIFDQSARLANAFRALTDSVSLSLTTDRTLDYQRILFDSASLADSFEVLMARIAIRIAEMLVVQNPASLGKEHDYKLLQADFVALANPDVELLVIAAGLLILVVEALSLPDNTQRISDASRQESDLTGLLDQALRLANANRLQPESLALVDEAFRAIVGALLSILRTEMLALPDSFHRVASALRRESDTAATADNSSKVSDALREVEEALALADAVDRIADPHRLSEEPLALSDTGQRATDATRLAVEQLGLSDLITAISFGILVVGPAFFSAGDNYLPGFQEGEAYLPGIQAAEAKGP